MNWQTFIDAEQKKDYFKKIVDFIVKDTKDGGEIYPSRKDLFLAYKLCPIDKVRVVIIGQDPYHGHGQAHGLSFSVPQNCLIPPSLKNVYKEIRNDVGSDVVLNHGCLTDWAAQGVFLLNSVLTVRKGFAGSHREAGWEEFTDATIKVINDVGHPVVFMLWGSFAKSKKMYIKNKQHLVLEAAHPSPANVGGGFLGCKHFSKANEFLTKIGGKPIDWSVK